MNNLFFFISLEKVVCVFVVVFSVPFVLASFSRFSAPPPRKTRETRLFVFLFFYY